VPRRALHAGAVLLLCLAALLWLPAPAAADDTSLPDARPVEVAVGFFLLNLSGVAERSETFEADLYLSLRWRDARLAFEGTEPRLFLDDAAVLRLKGMWWPQLEFVNTAEPDVTNRALAISPDGSVSYQVGVTAAYRADLDLRRFPFDRQTLAVRLQSFTWTRSQMVFVPDANRIGFNRESTFEGLAVDRVSTEIRQTDLMGWPAAESFSEFVARIEVRRRAAFYIWTVFTPVILIFLISCTSFVVPIEHFSERIGISLTTLLACIATQFAISFNLPQISYLTMIDRVFVVTYCCIALGVLISTLQATLLAGQGERAARRLDRLAGLGLPALFLLLLGLFAIAIW